VSKDAADLAALVVPIRGPRAARVLSTQGIPWRDVGGNKAPAVAASYLALLSGTCTTLRRDNACADVQLPAPRCR
jgi:hypothetical protein